MKVVYIGRCGHSWQADAVLLRKSEIQICGVAPGSEHENMTESFNKDVRFFPSYKEMLDAVKPDLAVVSPVFGLTGKIIKDCAKRKINVFSEKPVAATLEELEKVENAVKESGIKFCAMHYLRVSPAFWLGAKLVRDGAIGEIRTLSAQKSYQYGTRPEWYKNRNLFTGIIPWVGIHAIDWIYAFSGKKFLSVNAFSHGNPEKCAMCQFVMEDGVIASVNLDYYRPKTAKTHDDDRIRCVGESGVMEIRQGKVYLLNDQGEFCYAPTEAPEMLEEFLFGESLITPDEIFYVTRVALSARLSADKGQKVMIESL